MAEGAGRVKRWVALGWRCGRTARRRRYAQGLSLPLADRPPGGQRYFFSHTNWRPAGNDWIEGSVNADLQTPRQRAMRGFAAVSEEVAPLRATLS
jgi:hypothetical protein